MIAHNEVVYSIVFYMNSICTFLPRAVATL